METVPVLTLKRTDTTLDLSQKAKRAGEERKKKARESGGERAFMHTGIPWAV